MADEKKLQQKLLTYRFLEDRLNGLLRQRDMIADKISEMMSTLESIKEIDSAKDSILFPIGSEAYTFGKILEKDKLIVEIGANIALEKTFKEGKLTLEKRKTELEKALQDIQKEALIVNSSMEMLLPEIEKLS